VTFVYSPLVVPSAYFTAYPPFRRLPRRLWVPANRFTWALGKKMFGPILDVPVNAMRADLGLPRRQNLAHEGSLSPHLSALALSRCLIAPLPDWPSQVRITGFCFWDTPADWTPPAELDAFYREADPIIAVYFGSMAGAPFRPVYRSAVEAILRNGARALVIGVALETLGLPGIKGVLALPFAPFSSVFPRCSAVIHHGGIGTAGRVLQAGAPMLVVPWGYDQFGTAMMMEDSGVGRTLPARRSSVRATTKALRSLLADEHHRAAAREMSRTIASEDGVANASRSIEEICRRH
jgi:rhamnosyltransferase subunit B